ncbi:MAG: ribonuclease H-like domain-containing protein [Planctomycetota bacterium]
MLSESLRSRLEALNRERLPELQDSPRPSPPPRPALAKPRPAPQPSAPGLLSGAKVCRNAAGEHLVMTVEIDQLWPGGGERVAGRIEHLVSLSGDAAGDGATLTPGVEPLVGSLPDRAVLLDLETCGLAGAALFLIGLLRQVDGRLAVELLLARTYVEEQAVLVSLWQRLANADAIGTFNGKSFDWPMVMDRSRRHLLHKRIEGGLVEPEHVDLLPIARRRWKPMLPDCKLQTIERMVCRRPRSGDIPGAQIPAAYDEFVRSGRTDQMEKILRHNALDLVTLLDVTLRVAA